MTKLSKRLAALPSYPMAEIPAIKRRLLAQGVDVIDLGAGDADFAPPAVAVDTLARAVRDPAMSRYPFQLGLPVRLQLSSSRVWGSPKRSSVSLASSQPYSVMSGCVVAPEVPAPGNAWV